MKYRCLNINSKNYADYGGRGISIYPDWIKDFKAFFEYIGEAPYICSTLERVDNNKNYEPGNVKWASRLEQSHNRRAHKKHKDAKGTNVICLICAKEIYKYPSRDPKYCSRSCANRGRA